MDKNGDRGRPVPPGRPTAEQVGEGVGLGRPDGGLLLPWPRGADLWESSRQDKQSRDATRGEKSEDAFITGGMRVRGWASLWQSSRQDIESRDASRAEKSDGDITGGMKAADERGIETHCGLSAASSHRRGAPASAR